MTSFSGRGRRPAHIVDFSDRAYSLSISDSQLETAKRYGIDKPHTMDSRDLSVAITARAKKEATAETVQIVSKVIETFKLEKGSAGRMDIDGRVVIVKIRNMVDPKFGRVSLVRKDGDGQWLPMSGDYKVTAINWDDPSAKTG